MAAPEISREYVEDAYDFAKEMQENGYLCGFGNPGSRPGPGEPPGPFVSRGNAYVFPGNWQADFSDDVRVDDRFYFVEPTNAIIETCTRMKELDGTEMKIIRTVPFKPDGITVIFYEVQTRL